VAADQTATITASLNGAVQTTTMLLTNGGMTVSAVQCAAASLAANTGTTCTVTISQAAPANGVVVSLAGNAAALTLPASITIPAAATSATFAASTTPVMTDQTATITASLYGVYQRST